MKKVEVEEVKALRKESPFHLRRRVLKLAIESGKTKVYRESGRKYTIDPERAKQELSPQNLRDKIAALNLVLDMRRTEEAAAKSARDEEVAFARGLYPDEEF